MCKVIVANPKKDIDYVFFNHLYSRKEVEFTIEIISEELKQYDINLSTKDVQCEIEKFIKRGFVSKRSDHYECVNML